MLISSNVYAESTFSDLSFNLANNLACPSQWETINGVTVPTQFSSFNSNCYVFYLYGSNESGVANLGTTVNGKMKELMFFFKNSNSDNIIDKTIKALSNNSNYNASIVLSFGTQDLLSKDHFDVHQPFVGIWNLNRGINRNLVDFKSFSGDRAHNYQNYVGTFNFTPFLGYDQAPYLDDIYQVVVRTRDNVALTGIDNFRLTGISINGTLETIDNSIPSILDSLKNMFTTFFNFVTNKLSNFKDRFFDSSLISAIDSAFGNTLIAIKDFFFNVYSVFSDTFSIINSLASPISDIIWFSLLCLIGFTVWRLL